ncbi:MBL fold metallo-hydrolase [Cryptosporangium phraense]|uniref:MBL fold metallo-hydrolase n=2 Tax=Cryptosporangium phraense TaxID=2593070 RepID=A0A545ARD7_9ACTN|nr:MBL fold metallo-hydrolase [Cryptosporangium phraense]
MTLDGTNTWVLRAPGAEACVVIDPGPLMPEHLERVAALGPVAVTLLTHGHPDHAEGAARFAEMTGSDVLAQDPKHSVGGQALIPDGEPLDLAGIRIRTFATPGHTADSVSFVIGEEAVLTGDTILGRGTTVVAWPDGALGEYLTSLERLRGLGSIPVLPGHGPVLPDASAVAGYYLQHRAERLEQVRAAVAAGASTPHEVVETVYADVDRSVWPAAELSVRAQLDYLRANGRP